MRDKTIMAENHELISRGFNVLLDAFAPYIGRELETKFGKGWWDTDVMGVLQEGIKRDLPASGDNDKLLASLDIQRCLILFTVHWNEVFRKKLSLGHRDWAFELKTARNELAHKGRSDFSDDYTERVLDTMSRFYEQIAESGRSEEIRSMLCKFRNITKSHVEKKLFLIVGAYQLHLFGGQKLRACHTSNGSETEITGEIKSKKNDQRSLAIINLSDDEWSIVYKDIKRSFRKGELVPIRADLSITFSPAIKGEIRFFEREEGV